MPGEKMKEGRGELKRKRMMRGRKRQSREQVRAFLSRHQLFKGYDLPPTRLGTRAEVEKFPLLFSTPLPWTRLSFVPPFSLLPHLEAPVSRCQPDACTWHSVIAVQFIWFDLLGLGGSASLSEAAEKTRMGKRQQRTTDEWVVWGVSLGQETSANLSFLPLSP